VTMTITGKGFWDRRGTSKVYVGGKSVTTYVSWSATKIKVRVPKLGAGRKAVKVKTSGGTSNVKYFRVL
ncbi:MAG: IPT/TIG domain-containing protein, partial [Thermoleophilia bacterium]